MKQLFSLRRAVLALALLAAGACWAQQAKTTRILVAFPPGGPVDFVARTLADALSKELGQPVLVDNKAGGNGAVAAEQLMRSPADGSTLWLTSVGAVAINPALYEKLAYDPQRDLAPVSLVVNNVEVLVVNAKAPWNSGADLVAAARTAGNKPITMASSGTGSVPHLAAEQLNDAAKINLLHVPYKGAAPALNDVIAGHVDGIFIDFPVALVHIRAGKLKALGLAAPKRHPLLPETRTLEEMGISGVDSNNWYGIFAPKGTSAADIDRVNQAIRRALESESVKSRLLAAGLIGAPGTPAALAALQKADFEKWSRIIKTKGIKGE